MSGINKGARLNLSAAVASISVAVILSVAKGWATWTTGSTAMLGSLADTLLDLVASVTTLVGVYVAAQPADEDHRFGHGKAEALAAIFQVMLIAISAFSIFTRAANQLAEGARPTGAEDGIAVSTLALVLTLALLAWQRHVLRRTGSLAISTDHLHYKSDLLLNLAVILALVLDRFANLPWADATFGMGIALWLAWGARKASLEAIDHLMDREWPEEKKEAFLAILAQIQEISGVHDFRTRTAGNKDFVQFHVWLDGTMTVRAAHNVMDKIEARLKKDFPDVEMLIHPDPEGHIDSGLARPNVLEGNG
ncbi:MAG: cation diffusion facilitator family transporter [Novosphingobium sp.]|nr:cation diffusion facilitator family transporter [Novosphingobium sp.]